MEKFKNTIEKIKIYQAVAANKVSMLKSNLSGQIINYSSNDVNIYDKDGRSPLYHTVKNKNIEFVQ